jgi:mannosyl-oligosaccharide alpha-1,2-mannosidase
MLDYKILLLGLPAQGIDPSTGASVGGYVVCNSELICIRRILMPSLQTWGGGSDSYFEYLIKYAQLSNTPDVLFTDTWRQAVASSISTLLRVYYYSLSLIP